MSRFHCSLLTEPICLRFVRILQQNKVEYHKINILMNIKQLISKKHKESEFSYK